MENKPTVAEAQKAQWENLAFTGDAPFDDGATPEVLARIEAQEPARLLKEQQFNQRKQREKSLRQQREELVANTPLLRIARLLSKVEFDRPLSEPELQKCRKLALSRTKGERKDVYVMLYRYLRTQFMQNGGPYISSTRPIREADSTFRIADLIRIEMWPYRRAGQNGQEYSDADMNISVDRAYQDQFEPKVYPLVQAYCAELLKLKDTDGIPIFSKEPREHVGTGRLKNERRIRVSSLEKRLDTQAKAIVDAAQKFGELAARVAQNGKALVNLTNIAMNMLKRIEALEQDRKQAVGFILTGPVNEAAKNVEKVVVPSGPVVP
jgi:hypothetical protein